MSSGLLMSKRPNKGKSILELLDNYISIDLETTGLDSDCDSIIEVAAVRIEGGKIVGQFQSLANPDFEIDEFITELTGITNEMLADAPRLPDVLMRFVEFIGDCVVVAHNANFDINFIYGHCVDIFGSDFSNNFIDTMRLSRRLYKEYPHHRLKDLVKRFGIGATLEHRALSDAIAVHRCYEYMKNHTVESGIELSSLYPVHNKKISSKDINTSNIEFNEDTLIYGKTFVFTGTLQRMIRKDAMQLVVDMGGFCGDSVNKNTNYLVLGNNDYCPTIKGGKSSKQKKAEQLQLSGVDIETISENVFYEMLTENEEM